MFTIIVEESTRSGSKCTALDSSLARMEGTKVKPPLARMNMDDANIRRPWPIDKAGYIHAADGSTYRNMLADQLKKEYAKIEPGAAFTPANMAAVPIQATAGMRLISQEANAEIWTKICGKQGTSGADTITFAKEPKCGTIPGTTEGYFEWVAGGRPKMGSICSGGASLQIATPLYNKAGVAAFETLVNSAKTVINCTSLTLADGSRAPQFADKTTPTDGNCVDDYIKYHAKGTPVIAGCPANLCGADGFKGLAVVSFLGLRGRGGFFYGGINEVSAVMNEKCEEKNFAECSALYEEELKKDKFYQAVAAWFKESNREIQSYTFGTAAANVNNADLDGDKPIRNANSGKALDEAVNKLCSKNTLKGHQTSIDAKGAVSKGPLSPRPKVYQTCMKAMFTARIATGLFKSAIEDENKNAEIDWALGATKAQQSAFLQASERVETMAHLELLTNKVQQSLAGDSTAGAMLHYTNLHEAMTTRERKMLRTQN